MAEPNIVMRHNLFEKGDFKLESVGDVCVASMDGMTFERVGSLSVFTFKGKNKSRRNFRVLCKELLKAIHNAN